MGSSHDAIAEAWIPGAAVLGMEGGEIATLLQIAMMGGLQRRRAWN